MIGVAARWAATQKLPIEIEKIIVVRRDIDLGQRRIIRNYKCLAEISKVILIGSSIPDVLRRPFVLIQSGIKINRLTVLAGLTGLVPNPHLPPESRRWRQGFARIFN